MADFPADDAPSRFKVSGKAAYKVRCFVSDGLGAKASEHNSPECFQKAAGKALNSRTAPLGAQRLPPMVNGGLRD